MLSTNPIKGFQGTISHSWVRRTTSAHWLPYTSKIFQVSVKYRCYHHMVDFVVFLLSVASISNANILSNHYHWSLPTTIMNCHELVITPFILMC